MRTLSLGHSPDADDLFMYYAIAFGWVSNPKIYFQSCALDIETLNIKALKGELDISAISFGVYPLVAQEQCLLRTGVSFGEGYGPKLIKLKSKNLKKKLQSCFKWCAHNECYVIQNCLSASKNRL